MALIAMRLASPLLLTLLRSIAIAGALAVLGLGTGCASTPQAKAPSSNMPRDNAMTLARLTANSIGGQVYTIAPTGSMKPTLDEYSIVAVEPTAFEYLRAGDIVIYRSAKGSPIIHRLLAHATEKQWVVLGDNNPRIDAEAVTPTNFLGRVCAIFYTSSRFPGANPAFASSSTQEIPTQSPKIH